MFLGARVSGTHKTLVLADKSLVLRDVKPSAVKLAAGAGPPPAADSERLQRAPDNYKR